MSSYEEEPRFEAHFERPLLIELSPDAPEFIGEIDYSVDPTSHGAIMSVRAGQSEYMIAQHPDEEDILYIHQQVDTDDTAMYHTLPKGTSIRIGRTSDISNPDDRTMSREHCDIEYDSAGFIHVRNISKTNHTLIYPRNVTRFDIVQDTDELRTMEIAKIAVPEVESPIHCRGAGYSMSPEGYRRSSSMNQDRMLINNEQKLYGVFDGIGSRKQAGPSAEFIARSVERTIQKKTEHDEWLTPSERLVMALEIANHDIISDFALNELELPDQQKEVLSAILAAGPEAIAANRNAIENIVLSQVGTTACIAQLTERFDGTPVVAWASVGDSRLYLVRDKGLHQISDDEAQSGNIITNWLGRHENEFKVRRHGEEACYPGDRWVLVTDGVTGDWESDALADEDFVRAAMSANVEDAAWKLTRIAKKQDDRTAVVIEIPQA